MPDANQLPNDLGLDFRPFEPNFVPLVPNLDEGIDDDIKFYPVPLDPHTRQTQQP